MSPDTNNLMIVSRKLSPGLKIQLHFVTSFITTTLYEKEIGLSVFVALNWIPETKGPRTKNVAFLIRNYATIFEVSSRQNFLNIAREPFVFYRSYPPNRQHTNSSILLSYFYADTQLWRKPLTLYLDLMPF